VTSTVHGAEGCRLKMSITLSRAT